MIKITNVQVEDFTETQIIEITNSTDKDYKHLLKLSINKYLGSITNYTEHSVEHRLYILTNECVLSKTVIYPSKLGLLELKKSGSIVPDYPKVYSKYLNNKKYFTRHQRPGMSGYDIARTLEMFYDQCKITDKKSKKRISYFRKHGFFYEFTTCIPKK